MTASTSAIFLSARTAEQALPQSQDAEVLTIVFDLSGASADKHSHEVKVKNLLSQVRDMLCENPTGEVLLKQLETLLRQLDYKPHSQALALFISANSAQAVALNYPAQPRVVIGNEFALKEALYSRFAFPTYATLSFAANQARLFKGNGHYLSEVRNDDDHLSHLLKERSSVVKSQGSGHGAEASIMHKIEASLKTILEEHAPVVLIGLPENISLVGLEKFVAGTISGNYETATASEIAAVAEPVITAYIERKTREEMAKLDALKHDHKLATGASEIAELMASGRVETLYMEEGPGGPTILPEESLANQTMAFKGSIVFLPAGSLKNYGGLAAALRY